MYVCINVYMYAGMYMPIWNRCVYVFEKTERRDGSNEFRLTCLFVYLFNVVVVYLTNLSASAPHNKL